MRIVTSKLLPFCIFAGLLFSAHAQTQEIAHKSHSGSAATMQREPQGNLGLPPDKLVKIKRISKTEVVYIRERYGNSNQLFDTLKINTSVSRLTLVHDSLKRRYPNVELLNFKKTTAPKKVKKTSSLEVPFLMGSASVLVILLTWYYKRNLTKISAKSIN